MVVAYSNGATPAEIAKTHGMCVQAVREVLQASGVVLGGRKTVLSAEMRAEARRRHLAGDSVREIGRQLGVSHTTISRFLRSLETAASDDDPEPTPRYAVIIDARGPVAREITVAKPPLSAAAVQRLVQSYNDGATVADLAVQYDVHRATVRVKLRNNSVIPRERAPQHEHVEKFVQLYDEGHSLAAIGKRYDLSPSKVRTQLIRQGANLRS
jgi:transposase-like protein